MAVAVAGCWEAAAGPAARGRALSTPQRASAALVYALLPDGVDVRGGRGVPGSAGVHQSRSSGQLVLPTQRSPALRPPMSDEPIHAQLAEGDAHARLSAVEAEELLRRIADITRSQLD